MLLVIDIDIHQMISLHFLPVSGIYACIGLNKVSHRLAVIRRIYPPFRTNDTPSDSVVKAKSEINHDR